MTEMFGEAWSPMSAPDLAPDDDDSTIHYGHWGEERQCNQSGKAATRTGNMVKTNAIKEKQRNTAIHLLTLLYYKS